MSMFLFKIHRSYRSKSSRGRISMILNHFAVDKTLFDEVNNIWINNFVSVLRFFSSPSENVVEPYKSLRRMSEERREVWSLKSLSGKRLSRFLDEWVRELRHYKFLKSLKFEGRGINFHLNQEIKKNFLCSNHDSSTEKITL